MFCFTTLVFVIVCPRFMVVVIASAYLEPIRDLSECLSFAALLSSNSRPLVWVNAASCEPAVNMNCVLTQWNHVQVLSWVERNPRHKVSGPSAIRQTQSFSSVSKVAAVSPYLEGHQNITIFLLESMTIFLKEWRNHTWITELTSLPCSLNSSVGVCSTRPKLSYDMVLYRD